MASGCLLAKLGGAEPPCPHKEVAGGAGAGLQWDGTGWGRVGAGSAQLLGRAGPWMNEWLQPSGGLPASPPGPGTPVNLHEQSGEISRPVDYGAQPSVQTRNARFPCAQQTARLSLLLIVIYGKKTRTLLGRAGRPGPLSGFAQTPVFRHLLGVEGFLLPGRL